jgi:hypothetical protein
MTMKILAVTTAGIIVCLALGVFGWLTIHHVDTNQFFAFFGTAIGPTVGILYNNAMTKKVQNSVSTIEENTNGKLTSRIETAVENAIAKRLGNTGVTK